MKDLQILDCSLTAFDGSDRFDDFGGWLKTKHIGISAINSGKLELFLVSKYFNIQVCVWWKCNIIYIIKK